MIYSNKSNDGNKTNDINLKFSYFLNLIKPEGWMAYEYNPLHNFRSSNTVIIDLNKRYFVLDPSISYEDWLVLPDGKEKLDYVVYADKDFNYSNPSPDVYEPGQILDLDTEKLLFSLKNPVDITCLPSYDGSVNLILNDNKNKPRLINTRFSALSLNKYRVVDRTGAIDTNLYDREIFESDVALYKTVNTIPKIAFLGLGYNGYFKVGNYVFYFKLSDADGNESDFIGESGIVTCHIGNIGNPKSIRGGITDENSGKTVLFTIFNIDEAYNFVRVYYTRSTSNTDGIEVTSAHKIDKNFTITNGLANVYILGNEVVEDISIDEINLLYFVSDLVLAQTVCLNLLFFGNMHKPSVDYEDLKDLSLRIYPYYTLHDSKDTIGELNYKYTLATMSGPSGEYYNASNIYNKLGYWDEEMYRLGVVWIMLDNTLSPVFNIRGKNGIPLGKIGTDSYEYVSVYETDGNRKYVPIGEDYIIGKPSASLENSKGVIRINLLESELPNKHAIYSLGVSIDLEVLKRLQGQVKGFFIVRLKRIPTILGLALVLAYDLASGLPAIPCKKGEETNYVVEGFHNKDYILTLNYLERLHTLGPDVGNSPFVAICPEYNLRLPYFNNIFTGTKFPVCLSKVTGNGIYRDLGYDRHYYSTYNSRSQSAFTSCNITALGDNVPLVREGVYNFRGRAGEAEEAYKFLKTAIKSGNKSTTVYIRGSYGPYIGLPGYTGRPGDIINIYVPDYNNLDMSSYFKSRYEDDSAYYSVTSRIELSTTPSELDSVEKITVTSIPDIYRGDCFLGNYTHRLNRNFLDPEAPTNSDIVDIKTWKSNYKLGDKESNAKINRGDVNAILLGSWITFKCNSNINLSMRNWDDSYPEELGLTGTNRSFYPLSEMSADGNFKIPESFMINGGLSSTTSDKYNYGMPDVPYIKNLFLTRIAYSDISVNDAFKNGFRVFLANHYRDYPATYGGLIKLVELYNSLLCVFEHGVALIPVNERVTAGNGPGGDVFINTSNVLPENPKMLSESFGSLWPESVIKTPYYVYGVDTVGKKVWRTNGTQFEVISDFSVLKFLIDNITLTERELTPIIGVRNVKTHYNAYKGDVMFTFYDNLYGFEEKAWNICWNELLLKWITFFSWIPSYSANIDNLYFSFNRQTSKWLSKLGISNYFCPDADGVTLSNNILDLSESGWSQKHRLFLRNRPMLELLDGVANISVNYTLELDISRNRDYFEIIKDPLEDIDMTPFKTPGYGLGDGQWVLRLKLNLSPSEKLKAKQRLESLQGILLNIKANIIATTSVDLSDIKNHINKFLEFLSINAGYYESAVVLTSKKVYEASADPSATVALTTDFWKHGQGGIIDIKEELKPCFWYGELHPFEFEFVVTGHPGEHKIFNNLILVSGKALPESIHYEVVGESYDFAKDKLNIYVRLELTKKTYQNLGSDILYDRKVETRFPKLVRQPKSTIFPWYYERIDTINDIYHSYLLASSKYGRDYLNLSGTEVVLDILRGDYKLLTHLKICDMQEVGRLRGNCLYLEDSWLILIPAINYMLKNESWTTRPPLVMNNVPNDIKTYEITKNNLPKF